MRGEISPAWERSRSAILRGYVSDRKQASRGRKAIIVSNSSLKKPGIVIARSFFSDEAINSCLICLTATLLRFVRKDSKKTFSEACQAVNLVRGDTNGFRDAVVAQVSRKSGPGARGAGPGADFSVEI